MATQAGSLADQIAKLEVGETLSRTRCFSLEAGVSDVVSEAKRKMRNHMTKHQDRATQTSGGMYRMDTGLWLSHDNTTAFLTVAITRIA